MTYRILADIVLAIHLLLAIFVVAGLLAVFLGGRLRWRWVSGFWFRVMHLVAIFIIALQSWVDVVCPLTTWEMQLRQLAGDATYRGAFVAHWLETLLFYDAPGWVFVVAYTLFLGAVGVSWFLVPPRKPFETGSLE
jgi:hypothetical protein